MGIEGGNIDSFTFVPPIYRNEVSASDILIVLNNLIVTYVLHYILGYVTQKEDDEVVKGTILKIAL